MSISADDTLQSRAHLIVRSERAIRAVHCRFRASPQTLKCASVHSLWLCREWLKQVGTAGLAQPWVDEPLAAVAMLLQGIAPMVSD